MGKLLEKAQEELQVALDTGNRDRARLLIRWFIHTFHLTSTQDDDRTSRDMVKCLGPQLKQRPCNEWTLLSCGSAVNQLYPTV